MPFYLYGTPGYAHLDHVITDIPNIHLSAGDIHCHFESKLSSKDLAINKRFFFSVGRTLRVKVYRDPYPRSTIDPIPFHAIKDHPVVTQGIITLVGNLYVDSDALNPASEPPGDAPLARNKYGEITPGTIEGWHASIRNFHGKSVTTAPTK